MKRLLLIALLIPFFSLICYGQGKVIMGGPWFEHYTENMERYCLAYLQNTGNKTATTYEFHIYAYPRYSDVFCVETWKATVKKTIQPGESKVVTFSLPSSEYVVWRIKLAVVRYADGTLSYPEPD